MAITNNFIQKWIKKVPNIESQLEESNNQIASINNNKLEKSEAETTYAKKAEVSALVENKATKQELEVERARIDSFTSLQEGSTTGDAELIDARVAYDGTIYSNLGTANRTQFKNIILNVENIKDSIYDNTLKPINVRDISGIEKKVNTNCNFQSEGLFIQNLEGYDSYLIHVNCDMEIYTKDIKTQYYSICICNNYNGIIEEHSGYTLYKGENAARYRKSENNLPSVSSKLKVKKGDLIVFTFEKEQSDIIYGFKERDNYVINPIFIEKIRNGLFNGFVEMKNESLEILMKKCKYVFKRVKNENINIDTWRLYGGYLPKEDGTFFTMWENSDAEGVVQVKDEVDFIGGYHGDEKMLSLNIFVDGRKINETSTFEPIPFNSLEIYVESEVFHCGTLTPVFKRNKRLIFKNNILNISNEWTSLEEVTLSSAPLSLFQCFYKENDKEVFTHYSVANDYKLYSLANPDIYPANSIDNKKYSCNTSYGNIRFEVVKTSNQKPFGVVAKNFINSQNRLKLYYYTVYGDTLIKKNETLISEFEIEIV